MSDAPRPPEDGTGHEPVTAPRRPAEPLLGTLRESRRPVGPNIVRVGFLLVLAFVVLAGGAGYWQIVEARTLSVRPDNPLVIQAHENVVRGLIYDRNGQILAKNVSDSKGRLYRVYTDNSLAPLLGYASRSHGTAGLERTFDAELSGIGSSDPVFDVLRKFEGNPYDPADLTLTVSLQLQQQAVAALGNDVGAVVMLDPKTGQVLAMASTPTFNANGIASPVKKTEDAAFAAANANPNHPFLDRPTQGLYVPGSVFKIVTAIAGLESGAITPSTTYPDQPADETKGFFVNGFKVTDGHHPWTDGTALDFNQATEESCNIYYAMTGLKVGGDTLKRTADLLGFDSPLPFDLPTSTSSLNNGKGQLGGGFTDQAELANASYGQAAVQVTPLQMALVAAAVANNGQLMNPTIIKSTKTRIREQVTQPVPFHDVMAPDTADKVTTAMTRAVEGQYGRLFTTGAAVQGISTAGKSGTAQLGGSGEPNSWFIGFAPANDPKVAIAVVVEHGGSGAIKASPIAGRLMTYYLKTQLHLGAGPDSLAAAPAGSDALAAPGPRFSAVAEQADRDSRDARPLVSLARVLRRG